MARPDRITPTDIARLAAVERGQWRADAAMSERIREYSLALSERIDHEMLMIVLRGQARTHRLAVYDDGSALEWHHQVLAVPRHFLIAHDRCVYYEPPVT